jgi:hypothetical protein
LSGYASEVIHGQRFAADGVDLSAEWSIGDSVRISLRAFPVQLSLGAASVLPNLLGLVLSPGPNSDDDGYRQYQDHYPCGFGADEYARKKANYGQQTRVPECEPGHVSGTQRMLRVSLRPAGRSSPVESDERDAEQADGEAA